MMHLKATYPIAIKIFDTCISTCLVNHMKDNRHEQENTCSLGTKLKEAKNICAKHSRILYFNFCIHLPE